MGRFWGFFIVMSLLSIGIVRGDDTSTITVNSPATAVAGTSFVVNVEIAKNYSDGVARYQQEFPYGISVEPVECANADFDFSNQTLKLIWFKLPKGTSLKFSFKVIVHENIKGKLNLNGTFTYISSANERTNLSSQVAFTEISASPNMSPDNVVDIKDFKPSKSAFGENTFVYTSVEQQISDVNMGSRAVRQTPMFDKKTNGYIVSILLDKGFAEKYAKLEEEVPAGYRAEALETQGAVFDFKDSKVKFLWLELPAHQRFIISYRLVPTDANAQKPDLKGYFAFINKDLTEIHDVVQVADDVKKLLGAGENTYSDGKSAADGSREIPIKYVGIAKQAPSKSKTAPKAVKQEEQVETKQLANNTAEVTKSVPIVASETAVTPAKYAPRSKATTKRVLSGVVFKVQVAAVSIDADKAGAASRIKTDQELQKEPINGLVRYLIGPFSSYDDALAYKNKANKMGLTGAFIAAYNSDGVRININEAFASDKN